MELRAAWRASTVGGLLACAHLIDACAVHRRGHRLPLAPERISRTFETARKNIADKESRLVSHQREIQKVRDKVPLDGFSPHGVDYVDSVSRLLFLLHQIKEMGVLLKDVEKGLCDFPYMKQGRVVYLCWHLGEETITTWHEIETGFSGREPLDETDC
jgi:hypothetical protein